VVWNQTLAARQARWQAERTSTSYAQTDAALTLMKKDPGLAFLSEVSSVPLQQVLRHQHKAFTAFFARRARYPRFKSRRGRQCAHCPRRGHHRSGADRNLEAIVHQAILPEPACPGPGGSRAGRRRNRLHRPAGH